MDILQVELSFRNGEGNKNSCYDNLWKNPRDSLRLSNAPGTFQMLVKSKTQVLRIKKHP